MDLVVEQYEHPAATGLRCGRRAQGVDEFSPASLDKRRAALRTGHDNRDLDVETEGEGVCRFLPGSPYRGRSTMPARSDAR